MSEEGKKTRLPPKPTQKEMGLIIDPAFKGERGIGTSYNPGNELDRAMAEDEKLQAQDIRRLRGQEIQARMKARIAELEKQSGSKLPAQAFEVTPAMAEMIANQPPDKREDMLRIYTQLIAAQKSAPQDYNLMLLTQMMGFQKNNPDAGPAALQAFAKNQSDQIIQGITLGTQLATQNRSQNVDPMASAVQLLDVFGKMYEKSMMNPLEKLIEQMKPQPNAFEQILTDSTLYNRAKEMGWFGGGSQTASNELTAQIKQWESQTQIELARMNIDDRRWQAQHNAELVSGQQRIQTIKEILTGPLASILNAAGDVTRSRFGGPGGAQSNDPQQTASAAQHAQAAAGKPPVPALQMVQCPVEGCGADFYMNDGQELTQCPNCKNVIHLVLCPTENCNTLFLIPESDIRFECPKCHAELGNTSRLEAIRRQQEVEQARIPQPQQMPASPTQPTQPVQPAAQTTTQSAPKVKTTTPTDKEIEEQVQGTV